MRHYAGLIDRSEDGTYGLFLPDCPGCTAMGETEDELHDNAVAALREWMADRLAAGLEPPPPTSLHDLRTQPLHVDLFATSPTPAILMVPMMLDAGRMVRANISLNAGLLEAIDDAAKARGLTRSAFLASAAREKIGAA